MNWLIFTSIDDEPILVNAEYVEAIEPPSISSAVSRVILRSGGIVSIKENTKDLANMITNSERRERHFRGIAG